MFSSYIPSLSACFKNSAIRNQCNIVLMFAKTSSQEFICVEATYCMSTIQLFQNLFHYKLLCMQPKSGPKQHFLVKNHTFIPKLCQCFQFYFEFCPSNEWYLMAIRQCSFVPALLNPESNCQCQLLFNLNIFTLCTFLADRTTRLANRPVFPGTSRISASGFRVPA